MSCSRSPNGSNWQCQLPTRPPEYQKQELTPSATVGGQVTKRTTTLWDGWLPMMEIDYGALGQEIARRYYTWGPDVSGSLDGAAGIGGLIEIYEIKPTGATRSLPVQDGIGNVVGLVDETTGQSVATYQYGPFGEVVGVYGPRAESCPLRFQTKLYDEETGFYYFGKRYYDPKTQTWLSRDPERESGGINLYAYCNDNPVGNFDPIGLAAPPATPGSNPQQNTFDALLSLAKFIHGPAQFGESLLGLSEPSGDPVDYAGNLETVINGMTLDMPQIAAADGDPQMSAQVLQGFERQFTTPEGWGNLTFGLALGFAGPKVGDFIDAPVTPQPSGLDMISTAKARVDEVTQQYRGVPAFARAEGGIGTLDDTDDVASMADRIRQVAQQGYDYAVRNPRVDGLNRMQLGKDAEVQATRWLRRWAERNDVDLGPGGLQFQVRGANSVPDVVYDPFAQIYDFKLTPKAVRPTQTLNFQNDFPGYEVNYIFGQ